MRSPAARSIVVASCLAFFVGCQSAESPPEETADAAPTTGQLAERAQEASAERAAEEPATTDARTTKPGDAQDSAGPNASETQVTAAKVTPSAGDAVPDAEAATTTPDPSADSATLAVGDPAPPLSIAHWVMGDGIDGFDAGKLYVVEFWATWCGPCRVSMPHLSELSTNLGDDVKIVGITREEVETVEEFLEQEQSEGTKWRDVITYHLAIDQDGATNDAYMKAAEQTGIPTAFIVGRDGIIEWIGHPMAMDEPLASLVKGTYDRAAAIAEYQNQLRVRKMTRQLTDLVRGGDYAGALEMIDTIEKELGEQSGLQFTKLTLLQKAGRHEEADPLRKQLVEQLWDNAMALNHIAWEVATGGEPRDLELALRAALQASELTNHENPSVLDTVARVYYEQGNLPEAIRWQEKAVEHGRGARVFQETLKQFKAEQTDSDAKDAAAPDDTDS